MKKIIILPLIVLLALASCSSEIKNTPQEVQKIDPVIMEETKKISSDNTINELPASAIIPTFTEISVDFEHQYNKKNAHPFLWGAMIDIDSDGIQEVFVWWGYNQSDALFKFQGNTFVNITEKSGFWRNAQTTYGALSIDVDQDNDVDLLVAKSNGVYLYTNENTLFSEKKLSIKFPKDTVPFSLSPTDWNQDGFVDLYISTFIDSKKFKSATFNDPNHSKMDIALENNGDNTFTNVSEKLGLGLKQNNFISSFVDLNNDQKQDLVISPNTHRVRILENINNEKFEDIGKLSEYAFWMGLAIWDIDNDGDPDIFFSNIGKTIRPVSIARGDLRDDQILTPEWLLLRNDGDFQFTNATEELWLTGYEFAWWAVFEDFNLDGRQDLMVSENYIKWPTHKLKKDSGRFFIQNENGTFDNFEKKAWVVNKNYGQSPLVSDFNNYGYPDIVLLNMDGPLKAFLNDGWDYSYLTVSLPENANSLWAKVIVEKLDGSKLTKQFFSSQWFMTDNTPDLYFGLGNAKKIKSLTIKWPSGQTEIITDVNINSRVSF